MSEFDKKKHNRKTDDTDENYEIPDIVTGGTDRSEKEKSREKRVKQMKSEHTKKHTFEMKNNIHHKKQEADDIMEDLEFL